MLLKKYRNELLEALLAAGLDPSMFDEVVTNTKYLLKFKPSPQFKFEAKFHEGHRKPEYPDYYTAISIPGFSKSFLRASQRINDWNALKTAFAEWAENLQSELTTPDLWAEAAKAAQLFAPAAEPTDDKFNRTELAEVQGQLRQLQQSFTTSALPEAARQKLIELTQTAAVKAEGLTKKEWQNWIIGGFISAITSLALNPTQASEVLKLVKAAFGGLFLH